MKPRHSSSTSSTNTRSFPSPLCQPSVCWLLLCLQLPAATQPGRGTPTSKQTPWTQQGTAWPPHHLYRPPTGLYALFAALHPRCSLCHLPAGAVSSIILDIHLRRLYFNTEVPSNDVHAELFLSLKTSHWLPCGLSVYKVIKDSNLYKVLFYHHWTAFSFLSHSMWAAVLSCCCWVTSLLSSPQDNDINLRASHLTPTYVQVIQCNILFDTSTLWVHLLSAFFLYYVRYFSTLPKFFYFFYFLIISVSSMVLLFVF